MSEDTYPEEFEKHCAWYEKNLKIKTKDASIVPLQFNRIQKSLEHFKWTCFNEDRPCFIIVLKARQEGVCLDPATRVLTSDCRWVRLSNVSPGDRLVALDEKKPGGRGADRKMRVSTVEAKREVLSEAYQIHFDGGSIIATPQHRFLVKRVSGQEWRPVDSLKVGDKLRHVVSPWGESSLEDGWFGGMIDGEGHLRGKKTGGCSLAITQLPGPVMDRAIRYLEDGDVPYTFCENGSGKGHGKVAAQVDVHRMPEIFRIIGKSRPTRYVEDTSWWEGKSLPGKRSGVLHGTIRSIQKVPHRVMIDLQTSTKTFIAEGVVSHNSTWAEATLFRDSREMKNRKTMVMAHKEDASRVIFDMTKRYYDNLPPIRVKLPSGKYEKRKVETEKSSARSLKFLDTQSEFQVETAGASSGAARSMTLQAAHLSELDFYQNPEEVMGALLQTIPDKGKVVVVIESTANGPMLAMQEMWDRAVEGRNEYQPFFFPWYVHDEYTRPLSWDDLKRYAPREWIAKHKKWVEKAEREDLDGVGREGRLRGRYQEGREAPAGGLEPLGDGETGAPEGPEGPEGSDQGVSGDGSPEGTPPRGRSADVSEPKGGGKALPGGRGDDSGRNRDRSGEAKEGRQLHPRDSDREGELGRDQDTRLPGFDAGDLGEIPGWIDKRSFGVESVFRDSLTDYEISLITEFDVTLEQLNWLRYCLENKCKGDETRRRREYPSRPEEAFEASGADILDPKVLSKWWKESTDDPECPIAKGRMIARELRPGEMPIVSFDPMDKTGKVEIYEYPDPHSRYVLGLDPSSGVEGSDWTVGFVLNVDTGDQAAEFRATIDPDLAIDQIEWLGIFFNQAFTIIELNGGFGGPFIRHLADRNTLPLYEQMRLDRTVREWVKKPGWDTTTRTRPQLITELRESVRKERFRIKSLETIKECRTLWENEVGKIEARPGKHDDGPFAAGMALMARNQVLGIERAQEEEDRKTNNFLLQLNRKARRLAREEKSKIQTHSPVKVKHVRSIPVRVDGRRSVIG